MIYEQIANYLKRNGIKQSFLAENTSLSRQAISEALNGRRKITVEEYADICKALNVSVNRFI